MPRELTPDEQVRLEVLLRNDREFFFKIVLESDDLGSVVRGHAYIEAYLQKILERNMRGKSVVRWFAMDITRRLEIAQAMGEIDMQMRRAVIALAEIRNGLAHNPGLSVQVRDVKKLILAVSKLEPDAMEFVSSNRKDIFGPFIRNYGEHGALLRASVLFLKWRFQGQLDGQRLDPLASLDIILAWLRKPFSASGRTFEIHTPYDEMGSPHHHTEGDRAN